MLLPSGSGASVGLGVGETVAAGVTAGGDVHGTRDVEGPGVQAASTSASAATTKPDAVFATVHVGATSRRTPEQSVHDRGIRMIDGDPVARARGSGPPQAVRRT